MERREIIHEHDTILAAYDRGELLVMTARAWHAMWGNCSEKPNSSAAVVTKRKTGHTTQELFGGKK